MLRKYHNNQINYFKLLTISTYFHILHLTKKSLFRKIRKTSYSPISLTYLKSLELIIFRPSRKRETLFQNI